MFISAERYLLQLVIDCNRAMKLLLRHLIKRKSNILPLIECKCHINDARNTSYHLMVIYDISLIITNIEIYNTRIGSVVNI